MTRKITSAEELAYRRAALVGGRAAIAHLLRHNPDAGPLQVQLTRRSIERPILALIAAEDPKPADQAIEDPAEDRSSEAERELFGLDFLEEAGARAMQELLEIVLIELARRGEEWRSPFSSIARETGLSIEIVRALCRELRERGYASYERGLFSEDLQTAGSGYGVTAAGAKAAARIEARRRADPSDVRL